MHEQTRVATHTRAAAKLHIGLLYLFGGLNMRALFSIDCHFNFIYLTLIRIRYVCGCHAKVKSSFNLNPCPKQMEKR